MYLFNACEVVLEPQIMFEIKALTDSKAVSRLRRDEQYILNRLATQISDIRRGYKTTSKEGMKGG
jgi:hypothetical protein